MIELATMRGPNDKPIPVLGVVERAPGPISEGDTVETRDFSNPPGKVIAISAELGKAWVHSGRIDYCAPLSALRRVESSKR